LNQIKEAEPERFRLFSFTTKGVTP